MIDPPEAVIMVGSIDDLYCLECEELSVSLLDLEDTKGMDAVNAYLREHTCSSCGVSGALTIATHPTPST